MYRDYYTPVDLTQIPTSQLLSVTGTAFDFTKPHTIGRKMNEVHLLPLLFPAGLPHCMLAHHNTSQALGCKSEQHSLQLHQFLHHLSRVVQCFVLGLIANCMGAVSTHCHAFMHGNRPHHWKVRVTLLEARLLLAFPNSVAVALHVRM